MGANPQRRHEGANREQRRRTRRAIRCEDGGRGRGVGGRGLYSNIERSRL